MRPRPRDWRALAVITAAVLVLLAVLTASSRGVAWTYLASVLLTIVIYATFSLGLNLQFGYTGLVNFGHVAMMGLSAYTMAILVMRLEALDPPASQRLEGTSVGGAVALLGLCLLLAALLAVPLILAAQRFLPRTIGPRGRIGMGTAAAGLLGLGVFFASFPLGPDGADNVLAFWGVAAGIAAAVLAGLLLGLPAVRLREDYLAIVTIGAAEILRRVYTNEFWLTEGPLGINRLERPVVTFALSNEWWRSLSRFVGVPGALLGHLLLGLALLAYLMLVFELLARSPWGRVLRAVRDDEDVATALGKNANWYKLQSLMLGSAAAGVAGVLLVWHLSNVYPDQFVPIVTFFAFIIVILGGAGNHVGTLAGAVLLWGLFEVAGNLTLLSRLGIDNLAGPPQGIFIGLLLILVMMYRPQGVLGRKQEMLFAK